MNKKAIGKKLYSLRTNFGKSREEVAKDIGVSVSALQMYENGQRVPRDDIKIKLAEYFNTTVQEIFFNNKPHEPCGKNAREAI